MRWRSSGYMDVSMSVMLGFWGAAGRGAVDVDQGGGEQCGERLEVRAQKVERERAKSVGGPACATDCARRQRALGR